MNKKLISMISCGAITATVIIGFNELTQEIEKLNVSIEQIKKESENKSKEIKKLKEELGLAETDKKVLLEEQKVLNKKIEDLKKNNDYINKKVDFDKTDLKIKSGVDVKRLNKVLEDTGLAGLGAVYVDAEKTYGVNALFLTALTAQESGWGTSNRARTQNNLSGYAVYSDSSAGRTFSSKSESIYATAKLIAEDYLNKKGRCYKGVDIFSVNESYCPVGEYDWANNISSIAQYLVQEINSL